MAQYISIAIPTLLLARDRTLLSLLGGVAVGHHLAGYSPVNKMNMYGKKKAVEKQSVDGYEAVVKQQLQFVLQV